MHKLLLSSLLVALCFLASQPLYASDSQTPADPEALSIEREKEVPLNPWQPAKRAVPQANEQILASAAILPPLPFRQPQLGQPPSEQLLEKLSLSGDVETWTTAFQPYSNLLKRLGPLTIPETDEHWVRVDLSEQVAIAYKGETPVRGFVISSGLPGYDTVIGEFRVRAKVPTQTMSGGQGRMYYRLPNVQWVQYFFNDFGFHGTYWHKDFGKRKSHGCINMTNADAKWLFEWTAPAWNGSSWQNVPADKPGALVIVHE